jgi:2-keto-4-pentenoate hydratase/2-oxohepta-3-ene-1,7-dioic acid hydratase in catechol pathway
MRFVTFEHEAGHHLGAIIGESVVDLNTAEPRLPKDIGAYLRSGGSFTDLGVIANSTKAQHARALNTITHCLPVTDPGKIFCLGLNYLEHVKEGNNQVVDYPTIFMRGRSSLVAHNKPIIRPAISDKLDFEAELVLMIGKRIRHATKETALSAVAGYSCFNDGTLRDYQRRTTQWTVGKNFDQTGGFGPCLVTPDELPTGASGLKIESRLNGHVMQSDNTRNMMFPVVETIVTITQAITLEPGDMIVMGTPSGVGYARKPPVFMKHGDVCEIEIEGLGVLSNLVQDESVVD